MTAHEVTATRAAAVPPEGGQLLTREILILAAVALVPALLLPGRPEA